MSRPVEASCTAVLFLDFQVDVCAEGGKLMRSEPKLIQRFERVRSYAARVLKLCRTEHPKNHFVHAHIGRTINYTHSPFVSPHPNRLESYFQQHHVLESGSPGATFVEDVSPTAGECILYKHGMSAFAGSELAFWLNRCGVNTLILTGMVTQYSVLATALDAVDRGYRVLILEDCCTSRDVRRHEAALEILQPITELIEHRSFCNEWEATFTDSLQKDTDLESDLSSFDWETADLESMYGYTDTLVQRLASGDTSVTDQELITCIEAISEALSMRTNAEMGAFHIFSAAIPICYYRHHLATELFPLAMFGLLAMFYDRFEDQLEWLRKHATQKEPFGGLEPEMLGWLRGLIDEEMYLHRCFRMAVWWKYTYPEEQEIPGLLYIPDFIPSGQEKKLIKTIDKAAWSSELKRRVQHYGYQYSYRSRSIDSSMFLGQLPDWGLNFARDFYSKGFFSQIPDQLIVNEYLPGQGISPHIDCEPCFHDTIASLSLGSSCVMDFTHKQNGIKISKWLPARSLLILSGEARYDWKHAIAARKSDRAQGRKIDRMRRLSVTFRNVRLESTSSTEKVS